MKRNFQHATIVVLFLFVSGAYANNKLLDHKEWVTGNARLKYTISNAKQETIKQIRRKFVKPKLADEVKEYVHSGHLITSIDTEYDYPYQTMTQIKSSFWVDIHGFEVTNEPQLFTVLQEACIDPHGDTSGNQSTCVYSEDTIYVDSIMVVNIRAINIKAYNLKPGKYIASTEMTIRQIRPELQSAPGYKTSSMMVPFTVNDR